MISGLDEVIENHLMALETDPDTPFTRPRSTSVCLSRDADKRQPMGQLPSMWFPANELVIYVIVRRQEPDVAEQPEAPGYDGGESGKSGKGGKGKGLRSGTCTFQLSSSTSHRFP
jgi:hypothetical protein